MGKDQSGTVDRLGVYADNKSTTTNVKSVGMELEFKSRSLRLVEKAEKPQKVMDLSHESALKAVRVLAVMALGTTTTNNGQESNLLERENQEEAGKKYQNDIQERENVLREIRYRMAQDPNYQPPAWVPESDYKSLNINGVEPNKSRGGGLSDNLDFSKALSNQYPLHDLNG